MSAASKRHLDRVRSVPCVVCQHIGVAQEGPTYAHHIGDTADRSDWLTIAVCHYHHQGPGGFHHLGERRFNAQYKTNELKLLAATLALLEE